MNDYEKIRATYNTSQKEKTNKKDENSLSFFDWVYCILFLGIIFLFSHSCSQQPTDMEILQDQVDQLQQSIYQLDRYK